MAEPAVPVFEPGERVLVTWAVTPREGTVLAAVPGALGSTLYRVQVDVYASPATVPATHLRRINAV